MYWRDATFTCNAGDQLNIRLIDASKANPARIHNGVSWFDPGGNRIDGGRELSGWTKKADAVPADTNFLCPRLPQHALVGRFGQDEPFLVAPSWSGVATSNDFHLAVNDRIGQFFNNDGSYTVAIQPHVDFPFKREERFAVGRNYVADSGHYMVFQTDGNLVVYKPGRPVPENAVWGLNWIYPSWRDVKSVAFEYCELRAYGSSTKKIWGSTEATGTGYYLYLDGGVLKIMQPARGQGTTASTLWTAS